ncbi:hypothetical protein LTR17_005692 [Elasticomyces elasticus]|nr:hypothetical protein LTR17_005692 [Elasticomyces elasticus]
MSSSHSQKRAADSDASAAPKSKKRATTQRPKEREVDAPRPAPTPEQIAANERRLEQILQEVQAMIPDELEEINEELESGSYDLYLECNHTRSAKCRARKCVVRTTHQMYGDKIISKYRAIGVDVRKHLAKTFVGDYMPYERPVDANGLAAAIKDWIALGGKAYDASLYSNKAYQTALESYRHDNAASGYGEFERAPVAPKISDYTDVQPVERKLSDVVLQSMGAGHLLGKVPVEVLIVILDVAGSVPPSMTKVAWDAAEAVQEGGEGAVVVEDDQDAGVTSIPVLDGPSAVGAPALSGGSIAEPIEISDQGEVVEVLA